MVHFDGDHTEPTATSYMTTCTLEEGGYAKAVEYLQERFDQPRELHQIHCRKIADLQPIKGTQAELVQLASTVFNAISELERQGQATANAVLMSLVGSVLPKLLRNEWETLTQSDPKVPDLHDWIKFVRTKSVIAGREQKPVVSLSTPVEVKKPNKFPNKYSKGAVHVGVNQSVQQTAPQQQYPLPNASHSLPNQSRNKSEYSQGKGGKYPPCKYQCPLCPSQHYVFSCSLFEAMSVPQRRE